MEMTSLPLAVEVYIDGTLILSRTTHVYRASFLLSFTFIGGRICDPNIYAYIYRCSCIYACLPCVGINIGKGVQRYRDLPRYGFFGAELESTSYREDKKQGWWHRVGVWCREQEPLMWTLKIGARQ